MKGLYLNIPNAEARIAEVLAPIASGTTQVHHKDPRVGDIVIAYHPHEWADSPLLFDHSNGHLVAASGWFLFRGQRNNLQEFSDAFFAAPDDTARLEVLRGIAAGAFVLLLCNNQSRWLVSDAFGLHPHYCNEDAPFQRLAPAPSFLDAQPDADLQDLLARNNSLFGNLTGFKRVTRLEPGAMLDDNRVQFYASYEASEAEPEAILGAISDVVGAFENAPRLLPLSGGLDSRLLLASGSYDHGYTFGPSQSGDRPVARQFAHMFKRYVEFSLLDVDYAVALRKTADAIFDGVIARPFKELLGVYKHVHNHVGQASSFDGYLGDVLQRGLYLTHGGARGSLGKLAPILTLRGFTGTAFLRHKYQHLAPQDQERLTELYREKTTRFDVDEPHRITLFEMLYGRGARHVIGGGTIMTNQYFTAVAPFASTAVFRLMFGTSAARWLTYKRVRQIWSSVPREFSRVRTYSGYDPTWPGDLSRVTMLATKGLAKAGLRNRARSYEDELPMVRWA